MRLRLPVFLQCTSLHKSLLVSQSGIFRCIQFKSLSLLISRCVQILHIYLSIITKLSKYTVTFWVLLNGNLCISLCIQKKTPPVLRYHRIILVASGQGQIWFEIKLHCSSGLIFLIWPHLNNWLSRDLYTMLAIFLMLDKVK